MTERRPLLGGLVLSGVAVAALLAVYLHLRLSDTVSPVRQTVSDYVLAPEGAGAFALMCLALAVGSLGLVTAAVGRRPYATARDHAIAVLLTFWCLGLVVAALFPTDPMSGPMSPAGEAHRWAIVLAFVSLPAAGRLLAAEHGHGPGAAIGALATGSFAALGVLLVTYIPVVFPGVSDGPVLIGLTERLLLAADLALLVAMARPLLCAVPAGEGAETGMSYPGRTVGIFATADAAGPWTASRGEYP